MRKKYLAPLIEEAPTSWALIRAFEAEILENAPLKRPILEIGCGDGLFSKVLFGARGAVDVGIDVIKSELDRASKTGIYRQLIQCNAISLPFQENSFEAIFSNGVLEHIPQLEAVLQEIRRILTKNGYLIFTCPSSHLTENLLGFAFLKNVRLPSAAMIYGNFFNRVFKHHNLYDETKWKQVLQKHGFCLTSYTYYNPKLITRIHELLVPFAFPSIITKKILNTPILLKKARKMLYLSWVIPLLLHLPNPNSSDNKQSSIAIVSKKI